MNDEPHRIEDNEPQGSATKSYSTIKKTKKPRGKIIVQVGFDDNQKEFELWDYLYDVKTEHFELDADPDYKNRIQYYEIKADHKAMRKLRLWLMKNDFKYKFDKN